MADLHEVEFDALVTTYRRELHVHCYRILGSAQDAEEAVQDVLLSAWQHYADFEGRSSVRTWLYRIATNRCLDRLRAGQRRIEGTALSRQPPPPTSTGEVPWLQPFPDALLPDGRVPDVVPDPADVAARQEDISLAYVRALQVLPPRQRVVLVLRDVLQFRAAEVAAMLETTEESVTSSLKRARATLKVEHSTEPAPQPFSHPRERPAGVRGLRRGSAHRRMALPRVVCPHAGR